MNIFSQGPLSRMDRSALAAVGKFQRVYSWPTLSILFSFWTYLVGLFMATYAARYLGVGGLLGVVVVVVPLITLLLHVFITYSVYRASDEYVRQRILKSAAVVGVILAFGTTGYFCLEQLGYPHRSMIAVNLVGWSVFIILMVWVRSRAR